MFKYYSQCHAISCINFCFVTERQDNDIDEFLNSVKVNCYINLRFNYVNIYCKHNGQQN